MKQSYLKNLEANIERLLTNMDRNRDSDTFGCLCRPYWHDKTTDFPSAHQQIGVLPLAIVYGNELEDNPYYEEEEIQNYCVAGIEFWKNIQKRNGSFDEHYPQEHSLGATAWSLWAVTTAVQHIDANPEISDAVETAVDFIASYNEPGTIANHQAVTASALFQASKIVDVPPEMIKERIDKVEELQSEEGWFQEYRGADPGYQSTTIAHLARIWREKPEWVKDETLEKALSFFSSFVDSENYYGAKIGSRTTQHIHPTGFEILTEEFKKAADISHCLRKHVDNKNVLMPEIVDDKHFSWHHAEFLDSYLSGPELDDREIGTNTQSFEDFLIENRDGVKTFINLSKGGQLKQYHGDKLVEEKPGVTTEIKGKTYTANWTGSTQQTSIREDSLTVEGALRKIPENYLNGWQFILFRVFQQTAGRVPQISLAAKDLLIKRLITDSDFSNYEFKRKIDLDENTVEDTFDGERMEGKTRAMFIPNSEYFHN